MSIGSGPPLGYGDYERTGSLDAGALVWEEKGTVFTTPIQAGPFDCSRWQALAVRLFALTNPFVFQAQWFADAAATDLFAGRTIDIDPANPFTANISWVNMAPYVVLSTLLNVTPTTYQPTIKALFQNRTHPLQAYPPQDGIGTWTGQTIAAGGTLTLQAMGYFAGEIGVYLEGGTQGYTIAAQHIDLNGAYTRFWETTIAAGAVSYQRIVWPISSAQFVLTNTSGAAACNAVEVATLCNFGGV